MNIATRHFSSVDSTLGRKAVRHINHSAICKSTHSECVADDAGFQPDDIFYTRCAEEIELLCWKRAAGEITQFFCILSNCLVTSNTVGWLFSTPYRQLFQNFTARAFLIALSNMNNNCDD